MMRLSNYFQVSSNPWQPHTDFFLKNIAEGGRKIRRILDRHTDTLSSIGILVVTTGILASKIFKGMPKIIGNSGRLFLEFAGIIWLNVQVKEFIKTCWDCIEAVRNVEYGAILRSTVKVCIKAVNILLTCAYFAASITTFSGLPHYSKAIYMSLRPLGLATLAAEIGNEVCDYITNKRLLNKLAVIEKEDKAGRHLAKIMCCFLKINLNQKKTNGLQTVIKTDINDRKISACMVRQLDTFTLSMLQENIAKQPTTTDSRMKALNLYETIKVGLSNTQARVRSNLTLNALGYISRGVCKMYPDSLTEMIARWSASVLFTDELVIKYKLSQMDLADSI